jgi:hypothetical protein
MKRYYLFRNHLEEEAPVCRWQKYALTVWIVIFTCWVFWLQLDNRQQVQSIKENQATATQLKAANKRITFNQTQLEAAQRAIGWTLQIVQQDQEAGCRNYEALRDAVNLFHISVRGLFTTAIKARKADYARTGSPSDLVAVQQYEKFLKTVHTVKRKCAR